MPPVIPASTWRDVAQARPLSSQKRFRVPAEQLRLGMFVAELDRPWQDTPFLIQGFLVDSGIELSTLRKYCRHVFVDLEQSSPQVADAIRSGGRPDDAVAPGSVPPDALAIAGATQPEPAVDADPSPDPASAGGDGDAPECPPGVPATGAAMAMATATAARAPARSYRPRADVRITSDTRARFRQLVRGEPAVEIIEPGDASIAQRALSRLRGMLGGSRDAGERDAGAVHAPDLDACLRKALPPGTATRAYVDRHPVADELPRARQAFAQAEDAMSALVADIRAGRVVRTAPVEAVAGWLVDSMIDNPDALMWVAQLREQHLQPHQHGLRVALYLVVLGRHLGLPRGLLGHLAMIGMLSDIGKTRLPRALLDKPGLLNPAEYSIVKEHVRLGLEMLSQAAPLAPEIAAGIAQHHERLDGSGYPKGLKGDEINLYGRMAGIADSFTALITPRAYANPLAPQDALMSLYQWAGSSFHAPLVEQFVQAAGVFPVGTLVELSTGEVCAVLANNRQRRLEPRVMVLTWPDKRTLPVPVELDLVQAPREAVSRPLRIVRGLPSGAHGVRLRDYYAEVAEAETR